MVINHQKLRLQNLKLIFLVTLRSFDLECHIQSTVKIELVTFVLVSVKFRKLRSLYRENKKLDLHKTSLFMPFPILWASSVEQKLFSKNCSIVKLWNTLCFEFELYVVMLNLLHYIKLGKVSATPYCNYSLLYFLLLDIFCSTIRDFVEYRLLFPVAILFCILTICYYTSYVLHEVLLTRLFIVEYNYGCCEKYCWLYQLSLSLKYFLWDSTNKIECC